MAKIKRPLTDEEIRAALRRQLELSIGAHFGVLYLQEALLNRKLLTKEDIAEATGRVGESTRAELKKRLGPSMRVQ